MVENYMLGQSEHITTLQNNDVKSTKITWSIKFEITWGLIDCHSVIEFSISSHSSCSSHLKAPQEALNNSQLWVLYLRLIACSLQQVDMNFAASGVFLRCMVDFSVMMNNIYPGWYWFGAPPLLICPGAFSGMWPHSYPVNNARIWGR